MFLIECFKQQIAAERGVGITVAQLPPEQGHSLH